ncbi:hypothetical protein MBLNU459_g1237t1 [Dothideomycetes sp. NU459]
MRATGCIQTGLREKDARLMESARVLYINTLRSLRFALSNPGSSKSELQSAVMLLTLYELMSNRKEDKWIHHSGGTAKIMKVRGARAYLSKYDMAMYAVCRNFIVIEAFACGKTCFLESPEWNLVSQARAEMTPECDLEEKMHCLFVKAPRLARDARRAALGKHDIQDVHDRAVVLRHQLKLTYAKWWNELEDSPHKPVEFACEVGPFSIAYSFSNLTVAGMMCSQFATLIILNRILISSGSERRDAFIEEQKILAHEICKCVIQAQTRLLGSILLPFWLMVAFEGCAPEHREWIRVKLQTFDVPERVFSDIIEAEREQSNES